jgi:hypothetical protein
MSIDVASASKYVMNGFETRTAELQLSAIMHFFFGQSYHSLCYHAFLIVVNQVILKFIISVLSFWDVSGSRKQTWFEERTEFNRSHCCGGQHWCEQEVVAGGDDHHAVLVYVHHLHSACFRQISRP